MFPPWRARRTGQITIISVRLSVCTHCGPCRPAGIIMYFTPFRERPNPVQSRNGTISSRPISSRAKTEPPLGGHTWFVTHAPICTFESLPSNRGQWVSVGVGHTVGLLVTFQLFETTRGSWTVVTTLVDTPAGYYPVRKRYFFLGNATSYLRCSGGRAIMITKSRMSP